MWLHVERLEAHRPPAIRSKERPFIKASDDPNGEPPSLNEAALLHGINLAAEGKSPAERGELEQGTRAVAKAALATYTELWNAWAAGEGPRRASIRLYGDLFALKHALEAEATTRPQELVWGMGIATWKLTHGEHEVAFEYPLLTQVVEIELDGQTMALHIRPRATETRLEMDAFVACDVQGAPDVERTVKDWLLKHCDRPVTPFDSSCTGRGSFPGRPSPRCRESARRCTRRLGPGRQRGPGWNPARPGGTRASR